MNMPSSGVDPNPWFFGNEMTIDGCPGWGSSTSITSASGSDNSNSSLARVAQLERIQKRRSDLNEAVRAVWQKKHHYRNSKAYVLMLSWDHGDDDLGLASEIQTLERTFMDVYSSEGQERQIPRLMASSGIHNWNNRVKFGNKGKEPFGLLEGQPMDLLELRDDLANQNVSGSEIVLAMDRRLDEARISVTVTGIDHRVWTAYGLFDTYFSSSDPMETCLEAKSYTDPPDPLETGQLTANSLIWKPREYFFKVFETRIKQIEREWRTIMSKMETDITRYMYMPKLDGCSALREFKLLCQWSKNSQNEVEDLPFQFDGVMDARRLNFAQHKVNSGAILSNISFWIAVFVGTFLSRLARKKSRSRLHAGQAFFMSVFLLASPVAANSVGSGMPSPLVLHHGSSFLSALHLTITNLLPLFTYPQPPYPRSFSPSTLLFATLLSTTVTVLLFSLLRFQRFTKYFLCISLLISSLLGATFATDTPDFVFWYLTFGANGGLFLTGLEIIVSRFQNWRSKQLVKKGGFVGVPDMEGGKGGAASGGVVEEKGLLGYRA